MKTNRILALILTVLLLAAVFAGCGASVKSEAAAPYAMAQAAPAEAPAAAEAAYDMGYAEEAAEAEVSIAGSAELKAKEAGGVGYQSFEEESAEEAAADQTDFAAKIIYSANVSIQSTAFDQSLAELEKMVAAYGGFIENSNVDGNVVQENGVLRVINRWASYRVRVPQDRFEDFLKNTGDLGNVYSTGRYAENVTSRYTDFEARLDSLHTQEERLLDMLKKSEDVDSLVALEARLAEVRYETESIERNLRNLDMDINYSTVNVDLQEVAVYTPTTIVTRSFGEKLQDAFTSGWKGFARGAQSFFLWLVEALPTLLLLAVIAVIVILVIRKLRRANAADRAERRAARKARKAARHGGPAEKADGDE